MRKIKLALIFLLFSCMVFGQHESIEEGFVAFWEGGTEDVFYTETEFNAYDFGELTSISNLYLKSGQVIISKDAEGDIIDADMYYRIYEVGETPGEYINANLPWHSEWDDMALTYQMWWNDSPDEIDLNLLDGLTTGDYAIEVYFQVENGDSEILYLNNATQNYIAHFSYTGVTRTPISRGAGPTLFEVYPNPASKELSIKLPANINVENIKMIDCTSNIIYSARKMQGPSDTPIDIPISDLSSGTYFIWVESDMGVQVQRVIISK